MTRVSLLALAALCFGISWALFLPYTCRADSRAGALHFDYSNKITPKVFIISMYDDEGSTWYSHPEPYDLFARNITVQGLSSLFPEVHCTSNGDVCQLITGEAEINAAVSIASLVASPLFNLRQTYFMIAGVAGVSPVHATIASIAFARYAVQGALQYEIDAREMPADFPTGYVGLGQTMPNVYPSEIYGTEVYEVSLALRDLAMQFASRATLNDSDLAVAYRARYKGVYNAGASSPSVVACDVVTSDVFFSGILLSEEFANWTHILTNGTGRYCMTAQEDNATLEALLRGAKAELVDFSRIIVMRAGSDFDREPPGTSAVYNLFYSNPGGYDPALQNIYLAGVQVVNGILDNWEGTFERGIEPGNYIGNIFATLGGTPDFGPWNSSDLGTDM